MRRNKFNAKRTTVDGISFHSKAESAVYSRLKLLEAAHQIADLQTQVKYQLHGIDGSVICEYRADFVYNEIHKGGYCRVVHEVKGKLTPEASIKLKLFQAEYKGFVFRYEHKGRTSDTPLF